MTVSFHKYGDMFFPGTGDVKVSSIVMVFLINIVCSNYILHKLYLIFCLSPSICLFNSINAILAQMPFQTVCPT